MNPRLRSILIGIGLLTLALIAIVLIPRGLSLYYQSRGGGHIDYVLRSVEGIQALVCEPLPENSQAAREEVERGIEDLQRAVRFNRGNSHSYYQLGRAYCLLGEAEKALENYEQYTELRPENPLGYIGLGFMYEVLGESEKSREAWVSGGLEPHEFIAVGDEFFRQDQFTEAQIWYERSINQYPDSAESWVKLGEVYDRKKEYEDALNAYMNAWQIEPHIGAPGLIDTYKRVGNLISVQDLLEELLKIYPNSEDRVLWFDELGSIYSSYGAYDSAESIYKQAINEYPNQTELYNSLGWTVYERGDGFEAAFEVFMDGLEIDESSGTLHFSLGQLFTREEQFSQADFWFEKAVRINPTNQNWHVIRAKASISAGNLELAEDILNKVISLFPENDAGYYELALINYLQRDSKQARDMIEKALTLMPTYKNWYYLRAGLIYEQLGEFEKSMDAYEQVLLTDPDNELAQKRKQQIQKDHMPPK